MNITVKGMVQCTGIELDDYPGLVHYPENCRTYYVNDVNFKRNTTTY